MEIERTIRVLVPGFGKRIQEARKRDPRSMRELSEVAGITPAHWYGVEKEAVRVLPESTLRKIEKALGVDFHVDFHG